MNLSKHLKIGFDQTINSNKYQSKVLTELQNQNFEYLIHPSFQVANELFVFLFENGKYGRYFKIYYVSKVQIKDSNIMTDGRKKTFDQPIKNHIKTHNTFQLFQEMIKQLAAYFSLRIPKKNKN